MRWGSSEASAGGGMRRLNWGCGDHTMEGWINSDIKDHPGVDLVCDIRRGLPLEDDSIDYAVSIHALPELRYEELIPALKELRRVLKPAGVLRLALPDLDKAIGAYLEQKHDYFKVDPGDARSLGGRFITHILWYGYSRTLFTQDFIEELLDRAGFVGVAPCEYRVTQSRFPDIVDLDNREDESLFVEAEKAASRNRRGRRRARVSAAGGRTMRRGSRKFVVEVLGVEPENAADQQRLQRGLIRGQIRPRADDGTLTISGWVFGQDSRARTVELIAGSSVVVQTEVNRNRPDVASAFPDVPDAATSGFQLAVRPSSPGVSRLTVQARLDSDETVPIGSVEVKVFQKGLLRRLRS